MDKERYSILKEKLKRDRELSSLKREHEKTRKKLEKKQKNENKFKIKTKKETKCEESNADLTSQFDAGIITENKIEKKINKNTEEKTKAGLSEKYKENENQNHTVTQKDKNNSKSDKCKGASKKSIKKRRKKQEQDSSLRKQRDLVKKRVQKYRAKMTKEQLEEKRRKDRERYRKKKEKGCVQNIESLSERAKRKQRKKWKEASTRYRNNKKVRLATQEYLTNNSPPTTDNEEVEENVDQQIIMPLIKVVAKQKLSDNSLSNSPQQNSIPSRSSNSRQESAKNTPTSRKEVGRKKVKRDRASCYRKLKQAEKKIMELKKSLEKYRKQMQRQKLQTIIRQSTSKQAGNSPNAKINQLTEGRKIPKDIKKRLLFGEVLCAQLSENVKTVGKQKEKEIVSKVVSGKIMKKYKMIGQARNIITYKMHKKQINNLHLTQYERKKRNDVISQKIQKSVREFLERDSNSKMCPGKKEYVRKGKIKKQKRLLMDSYKHLFKKYIQTEGIKISQTTFWRNKPFWIVQPKKSDRETCACVKHANIDFIITKMHNANLIKARRSCEIVADLVCDTKNEECMFRRCSNCRQKVCYIQQEMKNRLEEKLSFYQWESTNEERNIKGKMKKIRKTVKSQKCTTVRQLLQILNKQAIEFLNHTFIMNHQMQQLQNKKKTIGPEEIIIQVDFSENYVAKYSSEVQSTHFGASKKQISLHTGLYYFRREPSSPVENQSFCSVSDNLDHQSYAIWAHLDELLMDLAVQYPNTSKLLFFSDGPTSQYRNRQNCYFLIKRIPMYFKNIKGLSWNYSESGHGKGPMDGVGGTLKRKADSLVLHGNDISAASVFVDKLSSESSIKMWEVKSTDIESLKKELPKNIPPVPQIMSVHQITWSIKNYSKIFLRKLSCFSCQYESICSHFSLKSPTCLLLEENSSTNKSKRNIISNITVATRMFPENTVVEKSLCFQCTRKIMKESPGIKCKNCNRTYHYNCLIKNNLNQDKQMYLCKTCVVKQNPLK